MIDSMHISSWVRLEDQAHYRNRKGGLSQNVMAMVSFGMWFLYVLGGGKDPHRILRLRWPSNKIGCSKFIKEFFCYRWLCTNFWHISWQMGTWMWVNIILLIPLTQIRVVSWAPIRHVSILFYCYIIHGFHRRLPFKLLLLYYTQVLIS